MTNKSKKNRQLLLLDEEGSLIASCNSIFDTKQYLNKPILPFFALIESVFPVIRKLQLDDPEVRFRKVETTFELLPGVYDYTFIRMEAAFGDLILWVIEDHTTGYKADQSSQQIRNERAIARELIRESKN